MTSDGYDFIIFGAVLGAGSALLFAKAYRFPSFPVEAAQTFLGANPFLVRNARSPPEAARGLVAREAPEWTYEPVEDDLPLPDLLTI